MNGSMYSIIFWVLAIGPSRAALGILRMVSSFWVKKVTAHMQAMMMPARTLVLTPPSPEFRKLLAMVTSPRIVEWLALLASSVVSGPKASPPAAWGSLVNSTRNRPKKIGIWSSIGRHEENGLAPASL